MAQKLVPGCLQLSSPSSMEELLPRPCCDRESSGGALLLLSRSGQAPEGPSGAVTPSAAPLSPSPCLALQKEGWEVAQHPPAGSTLTAAHPRGQGPEATTLKTEEQQTCRDQNGAESTTREAPPAACQPRGLRLPGRCGQMARLTPGPCALWKLAAAHGLAKGTRECGSQGGQRRLCLQPTLTLFPALSCSQADGRTHGCLSAGKP